MSLALKEAWKYQVLTCPNPAVGAVVVSACGKILSIAAHQKAGRPHAEVIALQEAYAQFTGDNSILELHDSAEIHNYLLKHHNGCFKGCDLYTTLEPCAHVGKTPACATLISSLQLADVFVGATDTNEEAQGGNTLLRSCGVAVHEGILEKECNELLLPFRKYLEGGFVFFKWASRLDGSTHGGTISSLESRKLVHQMRDVCDLIVIGGNTVRTDRPRLDARLVNGKAPDVLIYSRSKEFDQTIPLFNVPDRKVIVSASLEQIQNYRCVMIEGSEALFMQTRAYTDMYLSFIAPKFAKSDGFRNVEAEFEILSEQKVGDDIMAWMILKDS